LIGTAADIFIKQTVFTVLQSNAAEAVRASPAVDAAETTATSPAIIAMLTLITGMHTDASVTVLAVGGRDAVYAIAGEILADTIHAILALHGTKTEITVALVRHAITVLRPLVIGVIERYIPGLMQQIVKLFHKWTGEIISSAEGSVINPVIPEFAERYRVITIKWVVTREVCCTRERALTMIEISKIAPGVYAP
jgi:hypothetical protein